MKSIMNKSFQISNEGFVCELHAESWLMSSIYSGYDDLISAFMTGI